MALPSWMERLSEDPTQTVPTPKIPFTSTKKFFAVDASGSTIGGIMRAQEAFVLGFKTGGEDSVCKWHHQCERPSLIASVAKGYFYGSGGTDPSSIMHEPRAVLEIQESDLWILLTDGQIPDRGVTNLTAMAEQQGLNQVPVILMIVGGRYSTPNNENISVGVSFFSTAPNALMLYKNHLTGMIYVVDAKGIFAGLGKEIDLATARWHDLTAFASEDALKKELTTLGVSFDADHSRRQVKGISLGQGWDTATNHAHVKIDALLEEEKIPPAQLEMLLHEEALGNLALACKTRGRLRELHNLLVRHKQDRVVVRFEDHHGASRIMARIQAASDPEEMKRLREELRLAHAANRETYQRTIDAPSEDSQRVVAMNRLIDRSLQTVSEFEKSSYTADILSRRSNRAMRAEKVSASDAQLKQTSLDLSANVSAFRSNCSICCGDDEIMSIVLKRLETVEENTGDFALDFPLAAAHGRQNDNLVSSQMICFQCALLMERSIYQEEIAATIPLLNLEGPNREYIIHQLYLALTAELAVGASPVTQLFAGILDKTLKTKKWCTMNDDGDAEIKTRRDILTWMLLNLLERCPCRENFTSTGAWVKYPRALEWAAKELDTADFDSWIMQYPIAGFVQLMRWYDMLQLAVDEKLLKAIRHAKLIHFVTSKIMDELKSHSYGDVKWRSPFLELIYKEFNAAGIPKDSGANSIVSPADFWTILRLTLKADKWSDVHSFLGLFDPEKDIDVVGRVQLVAFWALYRQKIHAMPKTFFGILKKSDPFAVAVLDTCVNISQDRVDQEILSIFCPRSSTEYQSKAGIIPHDGTADVTPFCSPFGPSVLRCGQPGCMVTFYDDPSLLKNRDANLHVKIRDGRAKHLSEVHNTKTNGQMGDLIGQTGLPEPTVVPNPPTGSHYTLHISTARTWAKTGIEERRQIMRGDEESVNKFINAVRTAICEGSRGNIYSPCIDREVRAVLPSFFNALRVASIREKADAHEKGGVGAVCAYELDFTKNTILWKMNWELETEITCRTGD